MIEIIEYLSIILLSLSLLALVVGGLAIKLVVEKDEEREFTNDNNMYM